MRLILPLLYNRYYIPNVNNFRQKWISIITGLIILTLTVTSCERSSNQTNNISIDDLFSVEDINNSIILTDITNISGGSSGEYWIDIKNVSKDYINFPVDWGVKIFIKQLNSEDWIEIKNSVAYSTYNGENPRLHPMNDILDRNVIWISPVIPKDNKSVSIRVFVEGRVELSNSDVYHPVVGWIDIALATGLQY